MGRPPSSATGRVTVDLDPKVKQAAAIYAVTHHVTLTAMIEQGLRAVLARGGAK